MGFIRQRPKNGIPIVISFSATPSTCDPAQVIDQSTECGNHKDQEFDKVVLCLVIQNFAFNKHPPDNWSQDQDNNDP